MFILSSYAQYPNEKRVNLQFNAPYVSQNNSSVILSSDRIPSDFLGCTLGVTTELDALKNINRLGIQCKSSTAGVSEILSIYGDIECEGAKFRSVNLWFYHGIFWKIVFVNLLTDSKVLANTIRQKYSKFPKTTEKYAYIRYCGNSADLVHNEYNLQYTIRGGSSTLWED